MYTRTGDSGKSNSGRSLSSPKYYKVFHVLGELDLVQSYIGVIRSSIVDHETRKKLWKILKELQKDLFKIQALVYNVNCGKDIVEQDIKDLETLIDKVYKPHYKIDGFMLSSGNCLLSAQCDYLRPMVRRAERFFWEYVDNESIRGLEMCGKYLNRLSSVFYAMARYYDTSRDKVEY